MFDPAKACLITDGNLELFRLLMEQFELLAPVQIDRVEQAADNQDFEELANAAHDIKSSAACIAADKLHEAALSLEQNAKIKLEMSSIYPMIKEVRNIMDRTIEFYKGMGWISRFKGSV